MKLKSTTRRSNKLRRILIAIAIPVALLAITATIIAVHYLSKIDAFIEKTQRDFDEYVEYNLIAPKTNTKKPEPSETIAYLATDIYALDLKTAISGDLSASPLSLPDPTTLASDMLVPDFRLALISDDHLSLYSENLTEFYNQITVIERIKIPTSHQKTEPTTIDTASPFVLYISGIDTRENAFPFAARSDVNILLAINPKTHTVLSISTPRDYYVALHGKNGAKDKLTHAGVYGIDMSVATLADLYQVDIPYYLRTNFTSLVKVVDTLGGISVESDRDFKAYNGRTFRAGTNYLDGASALAYSRERKAFPEGDRMRGIHQQQVIEAIAAKLLEADNLSRFEKILEDLGDSFQTNMPADQIKSLAMGQLQSMSSWTFKSLQSGGTGDSQTTYTAGALRLYVMQPSWPTVEAARTALKSTLSAN